VASAVARSRAEPVAAVAARASVAVRARLTKALVMKAKRSAESASYLHEDLCCMGCCMGVVRPEAWGCSLSYLDVDVGMGIGMGMGMDMHTDMVGLQAATHGSEAKSAKPSR
jgi:hypothetical protein